jgi:hypothetical protein
MNSIDEDSFLIPYREFNKVPHSDKNIYGDEPLNKLPLFDTWDKDFNSIKLGLKKEELNSLMFRCDEFTKIHNGTHVLFSGCSYTWGVGLLFNESWSNKLYKEISKNNQSSGFFNLATAGSSIITQVINIIKYSKKYGNPNIIFLNIPNLIRFYGYNSKEKTIIDAVYNNENIKILRLISYQYLFILGEYCRSNGIKLYAFTWMDNEKDYKEQFIETGIINFDFFYETNKKEMADHIINFEKNNPNNEYNIIARDGGHAGVAYHDYWFNFIYKKYLDKNDNFRN